jgi:peroxiredoxin Q/BCP
MKLRVGDKARDFTAQDQNGQGYSLKEYAGQWLLLYFYPKDFTPGCTTEACAMRDNFSELKKHCQVVGVSADSVVSHKKFRVKHELPFTLLADPKREMIKSYGANGLVFPKRVSFLIDPGGIIRRIYSPVKPADHASQVLADLKELAA